MTITLRDTKGSALTYAELDANFTHADLYKSVQNISGPGAISTTTGVTFISTTGTDWVGELVPQLYCTSL